MLKLAIPLAAVAVAWTAAGAQVKCLGVFGAPTQVWQMGKTLRDFGINAVWLGHGQLKPEIIQRCRAEGARVFAEIGIFVGKQIAQEHPELWPINDRGERMEPDEWYLGLCPNVAWWREKKLDQIAEIARNHDIDGLWLDFIRYPCHWEVPQPRIEQACFCEHSIREFEQFLGQRVPGNTAAERARWILDNHLDEWTRFKCRVIADFCRRAAEVLHAARPDALLGIFSVPWAESNYDDAIHRIIAQDFSLLARWIQVFSPMSYHAMCGWPVEWIAQYNSYLALKTGRDVWPIVQAVDKPRKISAEEFEQVLKAGLAGGSTGVLVFRAQDCDQESGKLEVLRRVYTRAAR